MSTATAYAQTPSKHSEEKLAGAVPAALKATGIADSDSIRTRSLKILKLINDQGYFERRDGKPPQLPADPYEHDSLRSPQQVLCDQNSGFCNSRARVTAAILKASGVPEENLRIVSAVVNTEYPKICQVKGQDRVAKPQTGASGHVYVLVKESNPNERPERWVLIDTSLASRNETMTAFIPGDELDTLIRDQPVAIPKELSETMATQIPESETELRRMYLSGMTIFHSSKPNAYRPHRMQDRYDLIASGEIGNKRCRYSPEEITQPFDVYSRLRAINREKNKGSEDSRQSDQREKQISEPRTPAKNDRATSGRAR